MISQFYLASIHPECGGSVSNALRQTLGTRVRLSRVDPLSNVVFEKNNSTPIALFLDMEGLTDGEARDILNAARVEDLPVVMLAADIETISEELVNEFRVWTCFATRPEGRFRRSIQSISLDLINFHLLNEVENNLRDGFHRTTR